MKQKQIIAVLSASGVMTENDNRYKVLIHAGNVCLRAGGG